jgi:hypothetical protein
MFAHKHMLFLMMVVTIAFYYFVTNLWEQGGLLWIAGTIVSTIGITMIFCTSEDNHG